MQCISLRLQETKLNRSQGHADKLGFGIFFIVGSIFLFVSAIAYLDTLLFLAKAKNVQGTVIGLVPNVSSGGNVLYAPKVTFWEETRESRFEFTPPLGLGQSAYTEDKRIKVFYDPENPENAKIGDFTNLFAGPTILFLTGVLCFLCGFLSSKDKT
jgi:hypothetical protein